MKSSTCLCSSPIFQIACFSRSIWRLVTSFYRHILLRVNSFWTQICYFISLSVLGYWILKLLRPRTDPNFRPRDIDMFFTSVSAVTVSSMSTVEMEVLSNSQLIVLTILMFIGGEVFTSMVGLQVRKYQLRRLRKMTDNRSETRIIQHQTEMGVLRKPPDFIDQMELGNEVKNETQFDEPSSSDSEFLMYNSIEFLGFMVLGYLLVVNILGISLVSIYLALVSSAKNVLKSKRLYLFTFAVFTTVSTFANCGFVPTNENMMVFKSNPGLLLILIPQVFLGNTLFPPCLRFSIWVLGKLRIKKVESNYLLKNTDGIGYRHLLPSLHSWLLVATVLGFVVVLCVFYGSLDWNMEGLSGLNAYEKVLVVLFQIVNTRHAGESIVDLSNLSSALLVLFILVMYLPAHTCFVPIKDGDEQDTQFRGEEEKRKRRRSWRGKLVDNLIFSQLSYMVIFVILICITERKQMKEDPLNFNVLNITFEVISAYGNVGLSTGYSCERRLHPDVNCKYKWYGFAGKWSDGGKIVLIIVMFFGRLKKFNKDGSRAWILL